MVAVAEQDAGAWMDALERVMARIAAHADREGVVGALARAVVEECDALWVRVWLYDPAAHALRLRASEGLANPPAEIATYIPLDQPGSPIDAALISGEPIILDEISPAQGFRRADWLAAQGARAYAGFPLRLNERLVGVLSVFMPGPWSPAALSAFRTLARQAAIALDHARLLDEAHTLQQIAAGLASERDLPALLDRIVRQTAGALGAEGCAVWLMDAGVHGPLPAAVHGLSDEFMAEARRLVIEGHRPIRSTYHRVRDSRRPEFTRDERARAAAEGDALLPRIIAEGIVSAGRLPLFAPGGEVMGLLVLYHKHERIYTDDEALMAQAFTDQIAVALHNAQLDQATVESLRRTETLQRVTAALASSLDRDRALDITLTSAMELFGADRGGIYLYASSDRMEGMHCPASVGLSRDYLDAVSERYRRAVGGHAESVDEFYVADAQTDPRNVPLQEAARREGFRSMLFVALRFGAGRVGTCVLYHDTVRAYSDEEIRLARTFAEQAAIAIEHARLYAEERQARAAARRQIDRMEVLTRITGRLLAAADLDSVLHIVVQEAGRLCDASGAMVGLIDGDGRHLNAVAAAGEPRAYFEQFKRPALDGPFLAGTATGHALSDRRVVVVEDYAAWSDLHQVGRETLRLGVHAFVVAPLLIDGEPIGVLWVNDTRPRPFLPEDVALVQALADQAALAIEHGRLLRRGQDAAVLEERARLARDLHDSVTQSVFSAGIMANAAITQHERGSDALPATLARIQTVTRDALAEMRALLYELHPAALTEEGLAKALAKLVEAVQVRVDAPVCFSGTAESRLDSETELAIFRIVQEALANAAKYAQASSIHVTLAEAAGRLTVSVTDDGIGFDPSAPVEPSADGRRGGMGMRSMRERAAAAAITLRITSAPGCGTTVAAETAAGNA